MRRIAALLIGLGLVTAACSKTTTTTTPTPSTTPVVEIAKCQTDIGTQLPTEPTPGKDFKTTLAKSGILSVGSDNDYPPFEEIKPGASKPSGFDVDLYDEIAKRLGLTATSTTTNFDALFTQSVPSGTFDIGMSSVTIKESRKKTVDFTIPYYRSDQSLAVNVQKTPNIKTIDDLTGLTLGAQKGTTGADCADYLVDQGKAKEVKKYDSTGPAFQDLVAGRIAAIVNDLPASAGFIEKSPTVLKVVQIISTKELLGIAVSKKKPELRVAINEALTAMMNEGVYATIYKTWFGTEPPFAVPIQ